MASPLVVVEGPEASVTSAVADARAAGWRVLPGWQLPDGPLHDLVLAGTVRDVRDARAAVLAAVAGAGIVAHAGGGGGVHGGDRDLTDTLCDDLRRLGRLDHRLGDDAAAGLGVEERRLLVLLARGLTLGQAASRLHLSRRSVDRRLSAARVALGVATSGEAVIAYRERLDRIGQPPPGDAPG